jgi:hypothetical protein
MRPGWVRRGKPYLKNNQSKKGWELGSSGRVMLRKLEVLSSSPTTANNDKI